MSELRNGGQKHRLNYCILRHLITERRSTSTSRQGVRETRRTNSAQRTYQNRSEVKAQSIRATDLG